MTQEPTDGKFRPTRRTVIAAAAWSVPVIMVARAAPAFAGTSQWVQFLGDACKIPGESGNAAYTKAYRYHLTSKNLFTYDAIIVVYAFTRTNVQLQTENGTFVDIYQDSNTPPIQPYPSTSCTFSRSLETSGANGGTIADFLLPAGATATWYAITGNFGDSQNTKATIYYDVYRADTCDKVFSGDAQTNQLDTNPCKHGTPGVGNN